MTSPTTTRLHVTPLTPDLLATILPASLKSSASNISFHSIPTFPENTYGYLTLPTVDAEKLKKKMDGSMLKGKKFRVETARPQKRHRDETNPESDSKPVPNKSSKKQKTEDNVIDGYELTDRQVKRGWTESTDAKMERRKSEKRKGKEEKKTKTQPKSKYSDKAECLFRTKVPPNRSAAADDKPSKKKKKSSKESVVHEFTNTLTHPTFVRSGAEGAAPSATFEQGKGWVDDTGNLKEPASDRIRSDQHRPGQVPGAKEKRKLVRVPLVEEETQPQKLKGKGLSSTKEKSDDESEDWTSSSGGSSSDESSSDSESDDSTSSSSSDESDVSESEADEQKPAPSHQENKPTNSTEDEDDDEDDDESSGEASSEQPSTDVHPLEALFKRRAPDSAGTKTSPEVNTRFSFFGNSDDIESEEEEKGTTGPFTPFTKRDIQERGLRSAAPTPDTAVADRHIQWNESEDEDDDLYKSPVRNSGISTKDEESGFAQWFWDNRGDNNRAWKKRRRDAAKEERQSENRRKGMKGKS